MTVDNGKSMHWNNSPPPTGSGGNRAIRNETAGAAESEKFESRKNKTKEDEATAGSEWQQTSSYSRCDFEADVRSSSVTKMRETTEYEYWLRKKYDNEKK